MKGAGRTTLQGGALLAAQPDATQDFVELSAVHLPSSARPQ